jgi:hypothetical protein
MKGIEKIKNSMSKRIVIISFKADGKNSKLQDKKHQIHLKKILKDHRNLGMSM